MEDLPQERIVNENVNAGCLALGVKNGCETISKAKNELQSKELMKAFDKCSDNGNDFEPIMVSAAILQGLQTSLEPTFGGCVIPKEGFMCRLKESLYGKLIMLKKFCKGRKGAGELQYHYIMKASDNKDLGNEGLPSPVATIMVNFKQNAEGSQQICTSHGFIIEDQLRSVPLVRNHSMAMPGNALAAQQSPYAEFHAHPRFEDHCLGREPLLLETSKSRTTVRTQDPLEDEVNKGTRLQFVSGVLTSGKNQWKRRFGKEEDLSSQEVSDDDAKTIAQVLRNNRKLQKLYLSSNRIGLNGAKAIADALKENTMLQILVLRYNNIGPEGAKAIADTLKQNTTLQTLDLRGNSIGPDGAKAIAGALKENRKLQKLDLGGNSIGPCGTKDIVAELKENATLQTLNLWFNNIDDPCARAIAEVLKKNTTLRMLDLGSNRISRDGGEAIMDALKDNTTLQSLNLSFNNISGECADAIAMALKENSGLSRRRRSAAGKPQGGKNRKARVGRWRVPSPPIKITNGEEERAGRSCGCTSSEFFGKD